MDSLTGSTALELDSEWVPGEDLWFTLVLILSRLIHRLCPDWSTRKETER